MRTVFERRLVLLCLLLLWVPTAQPVHAAEEPPGLLLTWQQDPTTTMTIDWHTEPLADGGVPASQLRYRKEGDEQWDSAEGDTRPFPFSDRTIHRVELTDLEPATTYAFRVGDFERVYNFRTMPATLDAPLVFAVGGDTRNSQEWMERTNRVAMRYDPAFVVWGGDFSYADQIPEHLYRWYEWFDANMNTLISEEGRVVPIVGGIGNHEVTETFVTDQADYQPTDEWRMENAPYFFSLFAFPGQPGYGVLDFGDYLTLLALDSDHANFITGEQTQWLEAQLAGRTAVRHVIPFYHIPAFPGARSMRGTSQTVRETWVPLFEQHGVRVAFENHDHVYKRTHPIREMEVHPEGVIYMGDGAWGVHTRPTRDPENTWYLKKAESTRHAIIVTLDGDRQHFLVVSESGEVIDEHPVQRLWLAGLESAAPFTRHIASLLGDPQVDRQAAGRFVLEQFIAHHDPQQPLQRAAFLNQMKETYAAGDAEPMQRRFLAYQVLLMHADQLHGSEELQALLRSGINDSAEEIRDLAQTVAAINPESEEARSLVQTLDSHTAIELRETLFAELTNRPSPAFPGGAEADDYERVHAFKLPADGWHFRMDPRRVGHLKGWTDPQLDTSDWRAVSIEGAWAAHLGFGYIGAGWYRTAIEVPEFPGHDALGLHFEAVDENAWVWIDGEYVGQHNIGPEGWDDAFQLDVTDHLTPGQTHQITVRAMNTRSAGGIWKPVHIYAYRRAERR